MQTIALHPVRVVSPWTPAPQVRRPRLAQAEMPPTAVQQQQPVPTTPPAPVMTMPAPEPPKPAFIDSALVATIQDFTGALVTGLLAYGATYPGRTDVKPSRWAYVFGGLSAALIFKGFADLSRIRER